MQYALFTAQKEYARSGDKELADLLVDILVDRAAQKERSVLKIVLNESLSVAPKLTVEQYNVLSLVFLLRYTKRKSISTLDGLADYLRSVVLPFVDNSRNDNACFQHLEYAGCGSVQISSRRIGEIFKLIYPGLFWRGAHPDEISKLNEKHKLPSELVVECLNNSEFLQFNAIDDEVFRQRCEALGIEDETIKRLLSFQKSHLYNEQEVQDVILKVVPELNGLCELWNDSSLSRFTLTSVGIAVAHANIRRRLGEEFNISIWVH